MKKLLATLFALLALSGVAEAQITIPNSFTPFTTISSTNVNANFATLGTNALNRTGGTITGNIAVSGGVTIDGADISAYLGSGKLTSTDTSQTSATIGGGLTIGTGAVTLVNTAGKIPALSLSYFASVDGSALTNLSASALVGNIPWANLPSGSNTWTASPTISGNLTVTGTYIGPALLDDGNSGAAKTIDFSAKAIHRVTWNSNTTLTLTAPASAGTVILELYHDGTGTTYSVAFSPTVRWNNATTPTFAQTASAKNIVTLFWDGTTWIGSALVGVN